MRRILATLLLTACSLAATAQTIPSPARSTWRAATTTELQSIIPPRAPVVQERIETEMRTASGITDGKGKFIAGVVLITAGYSADGKYSHFFLTQAPLKIGDFSLPPGSWLIGWEHETDALKVTFYDSSTGRPIGSVEARLNPAITRVESFRIWPPNDRSLIQIGRFTFPYQVGE
jgi:hypothetical protein